MLKLRKIICLLFVVCMYCAFIPAAHAEKLENPFHTAGSQQTSSVPKTTLTAALKEYHKAKLSWKAVQADGYKVYKSGSKYGTYAEIADVAATAYTDETLLLGKTSYYKVRPYAVQNGEKVLGSFSNVRYVTPQWPSVTLKVSLSGTHSAKLSWTKLAYADGYEVERSTRKSGPYKVVADVSGNAYLDRGLSADTTYYYRVRPYDTVSGKKFSGKYASVKSIKAKWQAVSLKAKATGFNSVGLSWGAMGDADGFEVQRSTKSSGPYQSLGFTTKNTYSDTGLSSATYYYRVRPYAEANGEKAMGKFSAVQFAKPTWPALTPHAEQTTDGALLKWDAQDGIAGYEVQRSGSYDGAYQDIGTTEGTSFKDTGAAVGSVYYYRIRPYAVVGGSKALGPFCAPVYLRLFDKAKPLAGLVIGIDPGHQAHGNYAKEPVAPGSKTMKAKVSSGTRGVVTKVYEYQANLDVGLKLKALLESMGATVVMTRETNDVDISNIQRAQLFNKNKTDYAIRLHCNGASSASVHGAYVLIPTQNPHLADCKRAATLLTDAVAKATGCKTYPYVQRSDQAGFNFCDRMIVNIEMGYMTNPAEDRLLVDPGYQQRMAEGIANGILAYFNAQ